MPHITDTHRSIIKIVSKYVAKEQKFLFHKKNVRLQKHRKGKISTFDMIHLLYVIIRI